MLSGNVTSLANAVAGVVLVRGPGGGEVNRAGLSGGEGAKSSEGGGGEMRIWRKLKAFMSTKGAHLVRDVLGASVLLRQSGAEVRLWR